MNSTPITNDAMLMQIIGNDLRKIMDDVTQVILENIKEVVFLNVYEDYPYSGDYVRLMDSGGFLDAWSKDTAKFIGNEISARVGYDWARMEYNPDEHQHGNSVLDRRKNLAEYIESGNNYDFGGYAGEARPFWNVVERMLEDGSFDAILEGAFVAHDISFIRG